MQGTIRRIDDLGRIVIPKDFRANLGICEGDPLELYYDIQKKEIVIRKYNKYTDVLVYLNNALEQLRLLSGEPAIDDEDRVQVNSAIDELCTTYKNLHNVIGN